MLLDNYIEALRASPKFLAWCPERIRCKPRDVLHNYVMAERHYAPSELAKLWGVSVQTIREIFKHEEGVLKIGRSGTRTRRAYKTLRIPESIAERIHTKLSV